MTEHLYVFVEEVQSNGTIELTYNAMYDQKGKLELIDLFWKDVSE